MRLYGGVELGGTKVICAIGRDPAAIEERARFPTTTPDETLASVIDFLRSSRAPLDAIGVAAFGPLDLDPRSRGYGSVTTTPKPGWQGTPIRARIEDALGTRVAVETDVNAAAAGEWRWGAAQGIEVAAYVTVGTGIGAGIVLGGQPFRGLSHPEFGHLPVPRDPADQFPGSCPFHAACLEGLAAAPALGARWGTPPDRLPDDHPAWEMEAGYLGAALASLVFTLSPGRIVLGGGVMTRRGLHERVRGQVRARLAGYLAIPPLDGSLDDYIVEPALGGESGVLGAIALARRLVGEA